MDESTLTRPELIDRALAARERLVTRGLMPPETDRTRSTYAGMSNRDLILIARDFRDLASRRSARVR